MSAIAFCGGADSGLSLYLLRRRLRLVGGLADFAVEDLQGGLGFFAGTSGCFFCLFKSFTRLLEFRFDQLQMVTGSFGQSFRDRGLCEQGFCCHYFAILFWLGCLRFHIGIGVVVANAAAK